MNTPTLYNDPELRFMRTEMFLDEHPNLNKEDAEIIRRYTYMVEAWRNISLSTKFSVLDKIKYNPAILRSLACDYARHVLPIYEATCKNPAPRLAIFNARKYNPENVDLTENMRLESLIEAAIAAVADAQKCAPQSAAISAAIAAEATLANRDSPLWLLFFTARAAQEAARRMGHEEYRKEYNWQVRQMDKEIGNPFELPRLNNIDRADLANHLQHHDKLVN